MKLGIDRDASYVAGQTDSQSSFLPFYTEMLEVLRDAFAGRLLPKQHKQKIGYLLNPPVSRSARYAVDVSTSALIQAVGDPAS